MKIFGLQKMTLLDYPEHVACTVFLGGCDFRCPFCHNYELACNKAQPVMDVEELFAFLEKRKGLLDGVAITGGEPCRQEELPEMLSRIREMGYAVKLDTNGYHPEMLKRLFSEKLVDYAAMDIKNSPEKYAQTCGLRKVDLGRIKESIRVLLEEAPDCEFRTTVVEELHEAADFEKIGQMIRGADRYFLQCFTDRDSVPYEGFHAPSIEALETYAAVVRRYVPDVRQRGV